MYLDKAYLVAVFTLIDIIYYFLSAVAYGTHSNDDFLSCSGSIVVEWLVLGSDQFIDLIHILCNYIRECVVSSIDRLSVLEVSFWLFRRSHQMWMLWVESMSSVDIYSLLIDKILQCIIIPDLDLLLFVGCPETIKEMQCRHLRSNRREVCHSTEVHYLLNVVACEHRESSLPYAHDVLVIAEDRQRMCRKGSRGYMKYCRHLLSSDFIHVRYHQKKSLRCCKCSCIRSGIRGAVNSSGSSSF